MEHDVNLAFQLTLWKRHTKYVIEDAMRMSVAALDHNQSYVKWLSGYPNLLISKTHHDRSIEARFDIWHRFHDTILEPPWFNVAG